MNSKHRFEIMNIKSGTTEIIPVSWILEEVDLHYDYDTKQYYRCELPCPFCEIDNYRKSYKLMLVYLLDDEKLKILPIKAESYPQCLYCELMFKKEEYFYYYYLINYEAMVFSVSLLRNQTITDELKKRLNNQKIQYESGQFNLSESIKTTKTIEIKNKQIKKLERRSILYEKNQ